MPLEGGVGGGARGARLLLLLLLPFGLFAEDRSPVGILEPSAGAGLVVVVALEPIWSCR